MTGDRPPTRTRTVTSRTLIGLLSGTLILQIGWLAAAHARVPKVVAIEPGEALPFELRGPGKVSGTPPGPESPRCRVAFICSPDCPWCARLAERVAEDDAQDSEPSAPLWFLLGDSATVRTWATTVGLRQVTVFSLAPRRAAFGRGSVFGHVWFTPTRLILTPELEVRDVRPSDEVPSRAELSDLCLGGLSSPSARP